MKHQDHRTQSSSASPRVGVARVLAVCLALVSWGTLPAHAADADADAGELKFLAIGCGPYSPADRISLEQDVALVNLRSRGEFMIHLGDLMYASTPATPSYFADIATVLGGMKVPTFIVPGDNEWNDQAEPQSAWENWKQAFVRFHSRWDKEGAFKTLYPVSDGVQEEEGRPENFAFVRRGVLIIGINLPGGRILDQTEWAQRLALNASWVELNYQRYGDQVRAAVIFAQASPPAGFATPFRAASKVFAKPVLYLHADGHKWRVDRPWPEKNILRVQTDYLGIGPPVLVTVKEAGEELFQFDRRLIMRGPYLALGTPNSMKVVWRTARPIKPVVRYGRSPDKLDQRSDSGDVLLKTKDAPEQSHALHRSADGIRQYEALIKGLEPATTYYYAIYDGDRFLIGGNESYHFTTHPEPGTKAPIRFWVVGDSGTGGAQQAAVHSAMRTLTKQQGHPLDIFVHVGDMAYGRGKDEEFGQRFFKPYERTLRNTVCWPAMGNHEGASSNGNTGIGPYYDAYVLPTAAEAGGLASGTEAYYSFDYGNIHFIVLDSHDIDRSVDAPMAQWLKADLEQTTADWIFAHWHHPPYTKGSHDSDVEGQLIEMRENIMPILEDAGVDAVFTGHSHIYERSMLIDGAYHTPTIAEGVVLDDGDGDAAGDGVYRKSAGLHPHQGTVAVVTGHGGIGVSRRGTIPIMRKIVFPEHGSMIVDVKGDTTSVVMINAKGVQRDAFQIVKRGSVTPKRVVNPFQLPAYPALPTKP